MTLPCFLCRICVPIADAQGDAIEGEDHGAIFYWIFVDLHLCSIAIATAATLLLEDIRGNLTTRS
jgi:hypothetical protein